MSQMDKSDTDVSETDVSKTDVSKTEQVLRQYLKKVVPEDELEPRVFWRSYGTIAWVSFLFAACATMLFFATFDPVTLAHLATFPMEISALGGYTIGFFAFWVLCFCCTSLSCILLALPIQKRRRLLPDTANLSED